MTYLLILLTALVMALIWRQAVREAAADRRAEARIPVRVPVRILQRRRTISGTLVDVSRSGFQVEAWTLLPLRGRVRIAVPCGERDALYDGEIVWHKPLRNLYRYGVRLCPGEGGDLEDATADRLIAIFGQEGPVTSRVCTCRTGNAPCDACQSGAAAHPAEPEGAG